MGRSGRRPPTAFTSDALGVGSLEAPEGDAVAGARLALFGEAEEAGTTRRRESGKLPLEAGEGRTRPGGIVIGAAGSIVSKEAVAPALGAMGGAAKFGVTID
jgi:hypothetical protein